MREIKKRWMRISTRSLLVIVSIILVTSGTIGGTIAWMYHKTEPVNNVFTYETMSLILSETNSLEDGDGNDDTNVFVFPETEGKDDGEVTIDKDPMITIGEGDGKAWLFLKVKESDNYNEFFTYQIAKGWKPLSEVPGVKDGEGVYYMEIVAQDEPQDVMILSENKVYVKGGLSQEKLDTLKESDYPTLTFKAYAVLKQDGIRNAADAWELVK